MLNYKNELFNENIETHAACIKENKNAAEKQCFKLIDLCQDGPAVRWVYVTKGHGEKVCVEAIKWNSNAPCSQDAFQHHLIPY